MARSTKIKSKLIAEDSVEFSQLTPGTVPVLDGNKNIVSSVVTPDELANLSGTTSPIQDQLDDEGDRVTAIEDSNKVLQLHAYEDNQLVWGSAQGPMEDPLANVLGQKLERDGWYFENQAGQQITWYFFDGSTQATIEQQNFSCYTVITLDVLTSKPIFGVYSFPTGTDDVLEGFAHSRWSYQISTANLATMTAGKKYLLYVGENPTNHPEVEHIPLTFSSVASGGDLLGTELVFTSALISESTEPTGEVKWMVESLGVWSASYKHELALRFKKANKSDLVSHVNNLTNPHSVTKDQVGLGNVDNTSDLDKPISDATQDALDLKYDASNPSNYVDASGAASAAPVQSVNTRTGDIVLDKTDVGLNNVDNTSDINKPISTATQDALDLKQDSLGFTPENIANKSTDGTLVDNSDTLYPSQKAVKTYVDSSISAGVVDATSTTKGILKLTGDLSGTADSPTVPGLSLKIDSSREGQPNGIATLDGAGKVPAVQLPSYVDDVVEYANFAALPITGETGKIYVTIDTNVCYRWSGSTYVQITSGAVASVNGQTGIVVLDSEDLNHQQAVPSYWDVEDNSTIKAHLDELAARREAQNALTKEPTGFATRDESTTSFSDSGPDRTFTIAPVSSSFTFYVKGVKFTKTSAETLQIPNLAGNHFIYFNDAGVLSSTQVASSTLFKDNALLAIVYWNTDTNTHSYFAEERHGLQMDGETHSYLHTVFGAQYLSGLALQNFVVNGNGSLATHAQFTADEGSIRDEDLLLTLAAQTEIPVLFRQGSLWRKKAADSFPIIYSGTAGYTGASGRLPYNQLLSGSWQLTEIANNAFVLVHIFATNDKETPIIAIQGTAEYGNVTAARLAASTEITSLTGLPFAEFVALGSVVFESSNSYTNTPKAITRSINGGSYVDFRGTQLYTAAGVATSHNLLSGLAGDDHIQYHTDARGDARYYTKAEVDALVGAGGSAGDIPETEYNFSNSQVVPENITDFAFSNTEVRGFNALVTIEIDADSDLYEQFTLNGIQKNGSWNMSAESIGDNTGIVFSITSTGQIQYVSQNYTGFVSGKIKFRAITTSF